MLYILYIIFFIVLFIFLLVLNSIFAEPLHAESFVSEMDRGILARTPLSQPGQTIADFKPGLHRVTGGFVNVGCLPDGYVMKILGIVVDQHPTDAAGWNYHYGNQPFNRNLAKVLY